MKYIVYILQSGKDNSYYIGWTSDIAARIVRHNSGETNYTSKKKPWKIVYTEDYKDKTLAIKREKEIKRRKSRKYIENLIINYRGVEQPGSSSGS
ncbi:MAG: GIY-YIG nuclease family protein [bacterium]